MEKQVYELEIKKLLLSSMADIDSTDIILLNFIGNLLEGEDKELFLDLLTRLTRTYL